MKTIDMPRMAASFVLFLFVSTLLQQFTPLSTGGSLTQSLGENVLLGAFVIGFLFFLGRFRRDDRQRV